jgi:predicted RNA-binding protein associated with RNAse of E/G family
MEAYPISTEAKRHLDRSIILRRQVNYLLKTIIGQLIMESKCDPMDCYAEHEYCAGCSGYYRLFRVVIDKEAHCMKEIYALRESLETRKISSCLFLNR